jgi:hypothetical protein
VSSQEDLYNAFCDLTELDEGELAVNMILSQAEGADRIIFINKRAADYVSIQTHQYEAGSVEATAANLEDMEE